MNLYKYRYGKYTIYKTTCLINGKEYIGYHKTKDPHDYYLGSGSALKAAVQKYGRENFVKEVLFIFDNKEDMIAKETELVDEEYIQRSDTYNLILGGRTALGYKHTEEHKAHMSRVMKGNQNGADPSTETTLKRSQSLNEYYERRTEAEALNKSDNLSRAWAERSEEEKRRIGNKISEAVKGKKKSEAHCRALRKAKEKIDCSHDEDTKRRISKSMKKPQEKVQCPHCKKIGGKSSMTRYHFDNCGTIKEW